MPLPGQPDGIASALGQLLGDGQVPERFPDLAAHRVGEGEIDAVPGLTLGGRHTAAALRVQTGYPPKMLQEILSHASITTTFHLYGHLYPGDMDKYADRLDEAATETGADEGKAEIRPESEEDDPDKK